ncbi:sensor histidine kinase [Actinokineospora bangkokensis]|uniref:histidine kinase n=1 Tax=Actinokineospora bangkokensis TaxID=1193682 RepID=A0A1Q9LNF5_9PSEU|nr:histidine kinase [Actinokineospora bangkokensis]OLR93533.1 hypothetical protein BJP25_14635 [Actinokineospora bangkokensis]
MVGMIARLSVPQRVLVGALVLAAAFVALVEAQTAGVVQTKVGYLVCALLPVALLLRGEMTVGSVVLLGVLSVGLTAACVLLEGGSENTFGLVEAAGIGWVVVQVVVQHRPRRAVPAALLLAFALGLQPLRLTGEDESLMALLGAALVAGAGFLLLIGSQLRLRERHRADADDLARQNQRLDHARDLHDFVAHHVTAIVTQAKAVRFAAAQGAPPSPEQLDGMLAAIEDAGSRALVSMRNMVAVLRDDHRAATPRHRTLGEVVAAAVEGFAPAGPRAVARLGAGVADRPLPPGTLDAAHHVVQESLTNVLRHATGVSQVEIGAHLRPGDRVEVTVTDDGSAAGPASAGGHGLVGLTERVGAVGGTLTAGPTGSGWRVAAVLPA